MTPMMAQYKEIKAKYPDAILFYRLGDFYEMFFDDAIEASRLLQITLTSRNKGDHKAPMCGIPYHAAQNYIAKLTRQGKKVAICEQLSDPNEPGIVKRDVVRVITPGTTLDDQILDQKTNNFLLALTFEPPSSTNKNNGEGTFGLAYADISTGELRVTELHNLQDVQTELERIHPKEALIPADLLNESFFKSINQSQLQTFFFTTECPPDSEQFLKNFLEVKDLNGFGLEGQIVAIKAAALILNYLQETQKTSLKHIQGLQTYQLSEFMPIDESTLKNLEITSTLRENKLEGSLLWVLDRTITSMGGRALRYALTHPLLDAEKIQERLDAVDDLFQNASILDDLREVLKQVLDFERLLARLSLGHGNARDLLGLKVSLKSIPYVQSILMGLHAPLLKQILGNLDALPDLVELIEKAIIDEPPLAIREGGMIKDGYNAELDKIKKISRDGKGFIQALQEKEIERTGINSLKIRYNSVFGYYIEISKTNLHAVPTDYTRKQTLVNAERFITPELKEYEEKVLGAEEKIVAMEYEIFNALRMRVVEEIGRIQKLAKGIAALDMLGSFARVAVDNCYCKPVITRLTSQLNIHIQSGRHPVVEKMTFASRFVPNDVLLDSGENQLLLITGPNMGGKSTYLRQVALITLMAHIGSFVPAAKAEIGLVDRIFTRVGASDNLMRGQSTFMVEMQETAYILHNATAKSLIILDEIGRGTSTYDGMSIAWAITEFIHDKIGAKTLFATHYHELIALAEKLPHAENYCVAVKENEEDGVVFLYKIVKGGVDRSYGIEVAKLAGLPAEVVGKARQILADLEEGVLEAGIQKELTDASKRVAPGQTEIFEQGRIHQEIKPNPAIEELKKLDLNSMTPIEALNALAALKKNF
ncbi:MAG: DNA mismatch repair protein MutS [Candidatus Gracilibacteria bacterium]|jgi:DNA mismatch repair protein MutS